MVRHVFVAGSGPGAVSFAYGHDASGKTTTIGISQPAFDWMPTLAYARTYGAANVLNQVASEAGVPIVFNADGNMTSDGFNTYSWTYGNRMAGASRPGMTATYEYDSDDRRTRKIVNGGYTRTLWSGADELAEYDSIGYPLRRFVPDGTGAMDARLATVTYAGAVYWHHTDHQGSVIATSDGTGQTIATASYSPHGEFGAGASTPPQHSPFGYTGREYDWETGLYQYRARYYSPRLGQFLSMDPIGTKDDPNLYLYVGADPVNGTDPTGMIQDRFDQMQRRRDIGDAAADAQNRAQADGLIAGLRWLVNDIKSDPVGAAIDGTMIVVDVLTVPSGEAVAGITVRRGAREAGEAVAEGAARNADGALPRPPRGPGSAPRAERDPRRTWSASERQARREAQGNQCANGCGTRIDETNSNGHHVTRHADGGRTNEANHAEVCVDCHRRIHSPE